MRPDWDAYFMGIVNEVAKRATCDRGMSGCVIVKEKQILTTGYVGSAAGMPHCDEAGHQLKQTTHDDGKTSTHCVRTVHAEQNAICQAAKFGIALRDSTLYCSMTPCYTCAKMIVNAGIKRVVCQKRYHVDKDTEELFLKAGVSLEIKSNEVQQYENQ